MRQKLPVLLLLFALALQSPALALTSHTIEVPIIMYHKVSKDAGQLGKLVISPEELEQDFKFIQNSDYEAVTMADLIAFVHGNGELPPKPIVLSFDDGFFGDYHYVFPLAKRYNIRVVLSIIGRCTDEYSEENRKDIIYPHLTWPQIKEMSESGLIEVQNHSYDLHHNRRGCHGAKKRKNESDADYESRLDEDLNHLQSRVTEETGKTPTTFTYPFGAKSPSSDEVLKRLGFSASLSVEGKRNVVIRKEADCLFSMGRIIRPHGRSLEQILA